jgi:ParB-like chromosome segregation protein Spo0J
VSGEPADIRSAETEVRLESVPRLTGVMTTLPRPFSFPRLARSARHSGTPDIPKGSAVVTAAGRSQENGTPVASQANVVGREGDGTLRLPNSLEPPNGAAATRTDAFERVPIDKINLGERLRGILGPFVSTMTGSLSDNDLINPPVIRPDPARPGEYRLVCGLQRVNAERLRGTDAVLCRIVELTDDEAASWEIDENLVRASLSAAEEALLIDRRHTLHEKVHGKAKARGAVAANAIMGRGDASAILADASFTAETAKRADRSERTIQRLVLRAAKIGSVNLRKIVGTALDRAAELDALPQLPLATQEQLIEQAMAGASVSAVRLLRQSRSQDAPALHADDSAEDNDRPDLAALKRAWRDASRRSRSAFVAWAGITRPECP